MSNNRELLGPKAQDYIKESKRQERQLQRDLGVERQQKKDVEKVNAELDKRTKIVKGLKMNLKEQKLSVSNWKEMGVRYYRTQSEIERLKIKENYLKTRPY